MTDPDFRCN